MMIPLMWASKMIKANAEFAAEMETLDIKGLIEELRARAKSTDMEATLIIIFLTVMAAAAVFSAAVIMR
jgi:hypothetical protein